MNSLAFINKEIKQNKSLVKRYTNHLLAFPSSIIESRLEEIKEELYHLQQIKDELEAWYIIKNALELTTNSLGEEEIDMKVFFTNAKVDVCDTRKEFRKIKKVRHMPYPFLTKTDKCT